jgi:5-methyltetrahydrofolate--homocysteine methyltransferase
MVEIAEEFKKVSTLPVIIQSNAGLPELRGGEAVYPESPAFMAEKAARLVDIGVALIGGCCGTTPEHIRLLRRMVDGLL